MSKVVCFYSKIHPLYFPWAKWLTQHLTHHLIAKVLIFFIYLFFSPLGTIQTGQSKLNFVFLFSYMWSGPLASQMQCIRLVWSQASFIVNNGFLHRERIQLLPIKWRRYIIALIKQGYYEPAGAQCHRTEWKTGSLDVHSSGLSEQCSSPLPWYNFSSPNKMAVYSCCDISV